MLKRLKQSLANESSRFYRSVFLKRLVFIGITGSCGKTTTKELIAKILSVRFKGYKNPGNCNTVWHVPRHVLQTSRRDEFSLLELDASAGPNSLDVPLDLIKPQIGVVTNIGFDHFSKYGSLEAIAAEKEKLVSALPSNGTAVLNADDPLVLKMESRCPGRVITYGLSPTATFRAENINSDWPNRLSFTAMYEDQSVRVQTQLCGVHWVPNVLAAMAVGQVMGVPLGEAAEAIRDVPPVAGRMCPVVSPDGVTFIRDDCKAPLWTIPASIDFIRHATAQRKIAVIGTISDFPGDTSSRYRQVARNAMEVADPVIFVGPQASQCLGAKRNSDDNSLRAYATTDQLLRFFRGYLQPGDLVLLKGSEKVENLAQVAAKWMERSHAHTARTSADPLRNSEPIESNAQKHLPGREDFHAPVHAIVGLGNPGGKYENTPHNVGQQTLDVLASSLGVQWSTQQDAIIGRAAVQGRDVLLIKPQTFVNNTGPLLLQLAEQLGFSHEQCTLIHDDVDLEIGTVRVRRTGSDGGHRGVQSILVAFQSQQFSRVKIGVGRPVSRKELAQYVVTPFNRDQRMAIADACGNAADRALEIVNSVPQAVSRLTK